jgi:hypothetical protein
MAWFKDASAPAWCWCWASGGGLRINVREAINNSFSFNRGYIGL